MSLTHSGRIFGAALKPFHSDAAGLWRLADGELSLRMGFGLVPPRSMDLLGWWITKSRPFSVPRSQGNLKIAVVYIFLSGLWLLSVRK
jgi:hypothetical protein